MLLHATPVAARLSCFVPRGIVGPTLAPMGDFVAVGTLEAKLRIR